MNKKILLIITLILTVGLVTGCGYKKQEKEKENKNEKGPEIKVSTEKEIIKNQVVDEIKMTNTSLVVTNGISKLVTNVTNNTGKDYKLDEYTIIFKNEKGNVIVEIPGYVGNTIKNGETKTINSSVDMDLSNAKSIEYKVNKLGENE